MIFGMNPFKIALVRTLLAAAIFAASHGQIAVAESDGTASQRETAGIALVTLKPHVSVNHQIIRLGDIATITGGTAALRDQLKQLDLEEGLSHGGSVTILPSQVEFRLQIAGVRVDHVSIRGQRSCVEASDCNSTPDAQRGASTATSWRKPPATKLASAGDRRNETKEASKSNEVTVEIPRLIKPRRAADVAASLTEEGPLEQTIIQAAKDCVCSKLPWPASSIEIRVAQPLSNEVRRVASAIGYECVAELQSRGPAIGRVQVRVDADGPDGQQFEVPVVLDVRHFDRVVLTTKAIERGHVITADDLYIDRQEVTDLSDYCSSSSSLIGSTTKRSLRALAAIRPNDVQTVDRTENAVLIKRREHVKMTAHIGTLNVSAMGEALQEGRLGDPIRLRNIESNTVVQGKVVGPNEVEIVF